MDEAVAVAAAGVAEVAVAEAAEVAGVFRAAAAVAAAVDTVAPQEEAVAAGTVVLQEEAGAADTVVPRGVEVVSLVRRVEVAVSRGHRVAEEAHGPRSAGEAEVPIVRRNCRLVEVAVAFLRAGLGRVAELVIARPSAAAQTVHRSAAAAPRSFRQAIARVAVLAVAQVVRAVELPTVPVPAQALARGIGRVARVPTDLALAPAVALPIDRVRAIGPGNARVLATWGISSA